MIYFLPSIVAGFFFSSWISSEFPSLEKKRNLRIEYQTQKRKVKKEATTSTNVKDNFCLTFTVSGHLEPEFVDAVQNITVPVGRDVKFSCHVRHLGTSYKVSFSFILLLLFWLLYFPFFFLLDILDFSTRSPPVRPPPSPPACLYSLKLHEPRPIDYSPSIKWLTF
jgi:hypothetical protein